MRIRNRSSVLSWTSCNTGSSCCIGDGDESLQQRRSSHEAQVLLRPAVSVDVQEETGTRSIIVGGSHGIGIQRRRGDKWRQSLLGSGIEAVKEGETGECKWNGFDIRSQRLLDLSKLEGKSGSDIIPKENPSGCCDQGFAGNEKEWDSCPRSGGGFENTSSARSNQHCTPQPCKKRKRTAAKRDHEDLRHTDGNSTVHNSNVKRTTSEDQKQNADSGSNSSNNNNNNNSNYVGSQCRRRNGRGWQCSQRTLVGYSLCEHHLGKARLKSINNNNNNDAARRRPPPVNRGICKLKELRFLDPSSSCVVDDDGDEQKKQRSLKMLHN